MGALAAAMLRKRARRLLMRNHLLALDGARGPVCVSRVANVLEYHRSMMLQSTELRPRQRDFRNAAQSSLTTS